MKRLWKIVVSVQLVEPDEILKELKKLDSNKASQINDIPIKILKQKADIASWVLYCNFNNSLTSSVFPAELKKAVITPVYRKEEKSLKENYRPASILLNISKVFEWLQLS